MTADDAARAGHLLDNLLAMHTDRQEALAEVFDQLDRAGLISKVCVHRYLCKMRGCTRGTAIRAGSELILRANDYHLAPARNAATSVEAARRRNTMGRDNHWKPRTFDVGEIKSWPISMGVDFACRHGVTMVSGAQIVADCDGVVPGHSGAPTLL